MALPAILRSWLAGAPQRLWQRSLRRIGLVGWTGVALAAAGAMALVAVAGLQRGSVASQQRLAAQRERAARAPVQAASVRLGEAERATQFIESFPPFSQNGADMRQIFDSAEQAHVSLFKGDYAVQADPGSPFVTYVVNLPVHEPYPTVKRFAAAVLQALPHAALDEIRVSRADANGGVLDTTLRFTLVYRPSPARPGT